MDGGYPRLPGLGLIFLAAFTMRLPLMRQGTLALFLMGVGYLVHAFVGSYSALILAVVAASFGFHLWAPLNSAIGLTLSHKQNAGYVLGALSAVGSLAGIAGMGAISLISGLFTSMPLTVYYMAGGIVIIVSSLLLYWLPKELGATEVEPSRILIRGRYSALLRVGLLLRSPEVGAWEFHHTHARGELRPAGLAHQHAHPGQQRPDAAAVARHGQGHRSPR